MLRSVIKQLKNSYAFRQVLSNGDQCKIGKYGIGPYQISEQYYNEAVDHYPQLKNGGK